MEGQATAFGLHFLLGVKTQKEKHEILPDPFRNSLFFFIPYLILKLGNIFYLLKLKLLKKPLLLILKDKIKL